MHTLLCDFDFNHKIEAFIKTSMDSLGNGSKDVGVQLSTDRYNYQTLISASDNDNNFSASWNNINITKEYKPTKQLKVG